MNDSSRVRFAQKSDATMLAAVRAAADPASRFSDPEYFDKLVGQGDTVVLVAQAEESVIGYLVLQRSAHASVPARNPIRLWQLYVTPAFHGTGIATELMNAAFAHAQNQDHDAIWLGVSEHNTRGLAFYRKHGFEALGQHMVGSAEHAHQDVVMSCAVN